MAFTISASEPTCVNFSSQPNSSEPSNSKEGFYEGGHQLEKLEFALAIAETRGDQRRSELLRAQIADLGGNIEEPGT